MSNRNVISIMGAHARAVEDAVKLFKLTDRVPTSDVMRANDWGL